MSEKSESLSGLREQPDYQNKKQLAAHLGVSSRTVDNLMVRGLPYLKLTHKLSRFPRPAVDDWLVQQQIRRSSEELNTMNVNTLDWRDTPLPYDFFRAQILHLRYNTLALQKGQPARRRRRQHVFRQGIRLVRFSPKDERADSSLGATQLGFCQIRSNPPKSTKIKNGLLTAAASEPKRTS